MSSRPARLRIATRESRLALAQTGMVAAALRARYPGLEVDTEEVEVEFVRETREEAA